MIFWFFFKICHLVLDLLQLLRRRTPVQILGVAQWALRHFILRTRRGKLKWVLRRPLNDWLHRGLSLILDNFEILLEAGPHTDKVGLAFINPPLGCFWSEAFLESELDYFLLLIGELIRIFIEFLVEMPLLAPLTDTMPPKLLPCVFYILFFRIGVYLPGCGFIVLFKLTWGFFCALLFCDYCMTCVFKDLSSVWLLIKSLAFLRSLVNLAVFW